MQSKHSNKRPVESFLVGVAGEAFYNTAGAGNNLTDPSNGQIVLNEGQFGIFSNGEGTVGNNVATTAAPTVTEASAISIIQGTVGSADNQTNPYGFPLFNRVFETSGPVSGRSPIRAYRQDYSQPSFSIWTIGTAAGQLLAFNNTEYSLRIAFRGRTMDEYYNPQGTNLLSVSVVTPNFTTLGTAETEDWIYQYIVWDVLRNSSVVSTSRPSINGTFPVVGMAIDTTGAGGTAIAGITAGTFLPLVNTASGVRGITPTQDQVDSIQAAATAGGYAAGSILVVDLATAGTVTGGVADAMAIMGIDRRLSYDDKVPQVKTNIKVGLTSGFDYTTVRHEEDSAATEGQNIGRFLDLQYKATQGQRKYWGNHAMDPEIHFPSPFDQTVNYDVITIHHEDSNQIDSSSVSVSPQKCIIAVPTGDGQLDSVETALNSYLASAGQPNVL